MTIEAFKDLAEAAESIYYDSWHCHRRTVDLIDIRQAQTTISPRGRFTSGERLSPARRLHAAPSRCDDANGGDVRLRLRTVTTREHFLPLPEHVTTQLKNSPDPPKNDAEFPWPVLGKRQWRIDETLESC